MDMKPLTPEQRREVEASLPLPPGDPMPVSQPNDALRRTLDKIARMKAGMRLTPRSHDYLREARDGGMYGYDPPGREWPLLTLGALARLLLIATLLGGAAAGAVWLVPAR